MGCHTWFYKKIEVRVDIEQMKHELSEEKHIYFFKNNHHIKNKYANLLYEKTGDITSYVEDKGFYQEIDEFHDVFRVTNYPETKLFTLEETLDFIHNPDNKCKLEKYTFKKIKNFWEKYPDGMITFG